MPDTREWTTARYRAAADDAEKAMEWGRALDLWQAAMDNYPRPEMRPLGDLAKRDLARMEQRQDACRQMYFPR